jgi:hypothetical protein
MNDDCDDSPAEQRCLTGLALRISDGVSGDCLLRHKGRRSCSSTFSSKGLPQEYMSNSN